MASDPIPSRKIEGGKVTVVTDFLFLGSKITEDGDLQPWNQKMFAPWQESDDKHRQCFEKQRHYSADKVCIVKAIEVIPVVMYSCESWTIKKAERQRIDDFELWCWRRLLKVPWTVRSNQSTLNIHLKDWCWSWSSSILVIWCKQMTHWKSSWERLRTEGEEGIREWDGWMASLIQWIWTWANSRRQ